MPFYSLVCRRCGHSFEKQASISERSEKAIVCPACGGELRHAGINPSVLQDPELLPVLLKKLSFDCLDDMYAAIGYGGLTAVKAFGVGCGGCCGGHR